MNPFGFTRTMVKRNHAFIAPDGHILAPLITWQKTQGIVLISPRMGAKFSQFLALMEAEGQADKPLANVERFIYMLEGSLTLEVDNTSHTLFAEDYAYLPPNQSHHLQAETASRLIVFEREYITLAGAGLPHVVINQAKNVQSAPFMGDEDAQLKTLLPVEPAFDMAVNLFTFQPGTALPFVETHVMEHGLYLTEGQGIYRLDDDWYPIQAGDVIWMGPYCPQWFAAIGKTQSTYLYYKDMHRDPLLA